MSLIFADTSFFIGLVDSADEIHEAAFRFAAANREPMITSSAIILELGAYFAKKSFRQSFSGCITALSRAGVEVVHVTPELQQRGIERFQSRPDKDWSLTDCISFLLMSDRKLLNAATSDEHFTQAGFHVLLEKRIP